MTTILIGFMGAGKTSVARLLSPDFIDLDAMIEQQIEMPIATFFDLFGEADFRQIEQEIFESAIHMNFVIATGGGIVESARNQELLRTQSQVIYLQADFETLWARIIGDTENKRPLAQQGKESAKRLFEKRAPLYEAFSHLIVDTKDKSIDEIAKQILAAFPKK